MVQPIARGPAHLEQYDPRVLQSDIAPSTKMMYETLPDGAMKYTSIHAALGGGDDMDRAVPAATRPINPKGSRAGAELPAPKQSSDAAAQDPAHLSPFPNLKMCNGVFRSVLGPAIPAHELFFRQAFEACGLVAAQSAVSGHAIACLGTASSMCPHPPADHRGEVNRQSRPTQRAQAATCFRACPPRPRHLLTPAGLSPVSSCRLPLSDRTGPNPARDCCQPLNRGSHTRTQCLTSECFLPWSRRPGDERLGCGRCVPPARARVDAGVGVLDHVCWRGCSSAGAGRRVTSLFYYNLGEQNRTKSGVQTSEQNRVCPLPPAGGDRQPARTRAGRG